MPKTLARTTPIRELPEALRAPSVPRRGFASLLFVCPTCSTADRFGTLDGGERGRCRAGDCMFTWPRHQDWRVFVDRATLAGFRSRDEFEAQLTP
jgi:hypothetical protein